MLRQRRGFRWMSTRLTGCMRSDRFRHGEKVHLTFPQSNPATEKRRPLVNLRAPNFCLLFLLALSCGLSCFAESPKNRFTWPNGAKAAVSLAYDDALNSQLDNALPALNTYGLKATFYLQLSSPVIEARLPEWRAAAANGHELGNHTLFHQCSASKPGREWVLPHQDLDKISNNAIATPAARPVKRKMICIFPDEFCKITNKTLLILFDFL